MSAYRIVRAPSRVPAPGGKLIEEHVGRIVSSTDAVSVAHMVAPPGWSEPAQTPRFLEVTVMVRGRMQIEVGGDTVVLAARESIVIEPGVRVRYGNPFADECEYFAVCTPAFAPELAGREE